MDALIPLVFICAGVLGAFLVLTVLLGPDTDLDGPWTPGERPRWRA